MLVTDKGLLVRHELSFEILPTIPIHRGETVIEGVSAEEVSSIVINYGCRKHWGDPFSLCAAIPLSLHSDEAHPCYLAHTLAHDAHRCTHP